MNVTSHCAVPSELISIMQSCRRVVALTGAGVSAESGVPTFRDAQTGLWSQYRPEDLATPEAFERDPKLVWKWYAWRRTLVARAEPNAAHRALAKMETQFAAFTLITQNVDGLHQRAGSRSVVELHGNIHRTKCFEGGHPVEQWEASAEAPPRCPRCGGRLRPDVVWFNEGLPEAAWETALAATRVSEVFLCVGTSSLVYPAASLPHEALRGGAVVVEVNPDETPLTRSAAFCLRGLAGLWMPALSAAVRRA